MSRVPVVGQAAAALLGGIASATGLDRANTVDVTNLDSINNNHANLALVGDAATVARYESYVDQARAAQGLPPVYSVGTAPRVGTRSLGGATFGWGK